MIRRDRRVLGALQALLLTLPLFLGGRQPLAVVTAGIVVTALLVVTAWARRDAASAPRAPGVAAIAGFAALALAMTVPLPPAMVRALSPTLAHLTAM